jgi:hypothetical protein
MHSDKTVQKALIKTNGLIDYKILGISEKITNAATLIIGSGKFIVTLPKATPDTIKTSLNLYKGMLWLIEVEKGLPIVKSKHFQFFNEKAATIESAIYKFNRYYKNSVYEPGQLINLISFSPDVILEDDKCTLG